MNPAQNILKDLVTELKSLARSETIVGAPIAAAEFTLLPISRISLGVGAGGGTGEREKQAQTGEGGGGGGGIHVTPVALVAIRGGELNVHMLGRGASLGHTMEKLPSLLEKALEKVFETWQAKKDV